MTNYIKYEVRVHTSGTKAWHLNGKLHREDGPAVECSDYKSWWLNGKLHREDGPAIEWFNGDKFWYLNDEDLTEEEFNKRMTPEVEMTIDEMEKVLGRKVSMLNLEHKWLKTLLKRSPTVEMTMAQINEALGKNVKVVK